MTSATPTVVSGCNTGCGSGVTYSAPANVAAPVQAQPVMDSAPVQSDVAPMPSASPTQPSALDGTNIRNPVVDPSAFIFRNKNSFRNN